MLRDSSPSAPCATHGHASHRLRIISECLLRFGMKAALLAVSVAGGVAAPPDTVRIPYGICEADASVRAKIDTAFGAGIDVCAQVRAGLLHEGEIYDLDIPPNKFNREYFRWIDWINHDERTGSLSYEEIIQWNRVEDEFERLRKWAEKRRKGLP